MKLANSASSGSLTRRAFLGAAIAAPLIAQGNRPRIVSGVMSGDTSLDRAVIWSRTDKPARMVVTWRSSERGERHKISSQSGATQATDFTCKVPLTGLPPGQRILYEVQFESATRELSEPFAGHFLTAPSKASKVRFVWSGDVAGQGWGINPERGGMHGFEAMRLREPDFFIHSGDTIYADVVIKAKSNSPTGRRGRT